MMSKEPWERLWDELDWEDDARRERLAQEQLRQRAAQYSRRQSQTPINDEALWRVLSFRLGEERYALDVSFVRGVRPLGRMARLPNAPAFYVGVVAQRGRMLSVLDLRAFFGAGLAGDLPQELILIEGQGLSLAVLAQHVEDVQALLRAEVRDVGIAFTHGVSQDRLVILNMDALLSDARLMVGGKDD
jgi:purine-binding chemotaxis protein CheW